MDSPKLDTQRYTSVIVLDMKNKKDKIIDNKNTIETCMTSLDASYSTDCIVNMQITFFVTANHSNNLVLGKEFDCWELNIDQELFLLILEQCD